MTMLASQEASGPWHGTASNGMPICCRKECQYYGDIYEVERDYPSKSALVEFRRYSFPLPLQLLASNRLRAAPATGCNHILRS